MLGAVCCCWGGGAGPVPVPTPHAPLAGCRCPTRAQGLAGLCQELGAPWHPPQGKAQLLPRLRSCLRSGSNSVLPRDVQTLKFKDKSALTGVNSLTCCAETESKALGAPGARRLLLQALGQCRAPGWVGGREQGGAGPKQNFGFSLTWASPALEHACTELARGECDQQPLPVVQLPPAAHVENFWELCQAFCASR